MDALGAFLKSKGLDGGGSTHPVTMPDFVLSYEDKDITADVAPYLISFSYTDYLEGQSDELQVEFEDTDGRWLRNWYPEQGDALSLGLGDQFTGLVSFGKFEIAEIEYNHPPSTVSLKALSTGITKSSRTLRGKAYENTTLASIVRQVAGRLKLEVTGTVKNIPIKRVTQYQERDIEFLARLAQEYGHSFKIVGNKLVFTDNAELKQRPAVAVLLPEDIIRNGFTAGQINTLINPIDGVTVVNTTVPTGGAAEESDEAYRQRILLAPESFSVAGPVGASEYFARRVSPTICDVHVGNLTGVDGLPIGGQVRVTLLTKNGVPSSELVSEVQVFLSGERVRPLCDTVTVNAPAVVDYMLDAELVLYTGVNTAEVLAAAKRAWADYEAARREKLGLDIVPLDIQTTLKVSGVYNVVLKKPTLIVVKPDQWARCTSVNIRASSETAEG